MQQCYTGAYPVIFPTLDPVLAAAPGDEIDYPTLLPGFEPTAPSTPAAPAADEAGDGAAPLTPEES